MKNKSKIFFAKLQNLILEDTLSKKSSYKKLGDEIFLNEHFVKYYKL